MSTSDVRSRQTSQPASEPERARDHSLASVLTPSTPSEEAPQRSMDPPVAAPSNDPSDNTHNTADRDVNPTVPAADNTSKKSAGRKHAKEPDRNSRKRQTKKKHARKQRSWSSSDTESDSSVSTSVSESSAASKSASEDSSSEESSSSESEVCQKKRRPQKKVKAGKKAHKSGKKSRLRRSEPSSDGGDTEGDFSSQDEKVLRKLLAKVKVKKARKNRSEDEPSEDQQDDDSDADSDGIAFQKRGDTKAKRDRRRKARGKRTDDQVEPKRPKSKSKKKTASKVAFKRVDQLWDNTIHNYKLSETVDDPDTSEWDQYIFTVRRRFDWESRYLETFVDIKSKPLREALARIMDGVKGVSMVQETAVVDPNMLFLYLEDARQYRKELKQAAKTEKKRKARKAAAVKAAHLRVLIKYLDTDYAETKKTLYPLLDSNMITFDLLWALFKPNTIAYTSAYGNEDEPRAFKIECSSKEASFMGGQWYSVEGRYLEYDGKSFGKGKIAASVESFKGVCKITALACYPLQYHREPEAIRAKLIERGKKFVSLRGMNYRFHKGMAFYKKRRSAVKVNVNGRVMIDPALHRRINPNYPVSIVKNSDIYDSEDEDASDEESYCRRQDSDLDNDRGSPDAPRIKYKVVNDEKGRAQVVQVEVDENGDVIEKEKTDEVVDPADRTFSEEELLIASPVVLGFAFSEKLWLEFTVSGVSEIEWNEDAFDSLVLPVEQKSVIKALVESHTFHAAQNIDDVIQGKGKGLVSVLHGPPGTGKTLTAEGIAELLKRPLYMVSAGELGTDSRTLEAELNKILDIAHSWGAVLLLDEADIFLERRTIQDIHRNALVSIFLRLLEYFQGILFLTTNRVETFDDAFQSRIHLAIRYGELNAKAKRSVWKMFLGRVQAKEGVQTAKFSDRDLDALARHALNGRQIKNAVRTAQALAVNEKSPLSMEHIKRVLDVAENFEHDLRGGVGYLDAMRSYT